MTSHIAHEKVNRLVKEKSPYLLQHAHNPVNWYSWSGEAFEKAKAEDKPIFLSIGYSTCHWCHVMAHESFEDKEVAQLMNDAFVSIKVDREERPDIDNVYMTVCQMMTGSGGWPLTIIMTPDKKPFFAATYIPKKSMFGRVGMMELIPRIKRAWKNERDKLLESAEDITAHLQNMVNDSEGSGMDRNTLDKAYKEFSKRFDSIRGGFGGAPKFPTPHNIMFLFRYYKLSGEKRALEMGLKTIDTMALGGIFDHIGYGFHRYSTDATWLLPHFEKMLYDQALLTISYIEAYQITKNEKYADVAKKVLEYVMRDMTSSYGGFYCAEDADSEGEEGKFYVWSYDELSTILEKDEMDIVTNIFNVKKEGNFRDESTGKQTGFNILHLKKDIDEIDKSAVEDIRKKLFEVRKKRIRPGRDEKILTDWNGLMIAAFSKAYAVFKDEKYLDYAKKAVDFILDGFEEHGRLMHRAFEKDWSIPGNIDDYAFFVFGLIEIYEACFEIKYLKRAIDINNDMIRLFIDEKSGGFYFTPKDAEEVLLRTKEIYDGAVPSGNSIAMHNLIRLSRITGDSRLEEIASKESKAFSDEINSMPSAYSMMLNAVSFETGRSFEIAVVGNKEDVNMKNIIDNLHREFTPNSVVVPKTNDNESEISTLAEFTQQYPLNPDKTMVHICTNGMCMLPTSDIDEMMKLLKD